MSQHTQGFGIYVIGGIIPNRSLSDEQLLVRNAARQSLSEIVHRERLFLVYEPDPGDQVLTTPRSWIPPALAGISNAHALLKGKHNQDLEHCSLVFAVLDEAPPNLSALLTIAEQRGLPVILIRSKQMRQEHLAPDRNHAFLIELDLSDSTWRDVLSGTLEELIDRARHGHLA